VKRWNVGEMDWYSWVLGSTFIILLLVQLLVMPSAVQASVYTDPSVTTNPAINIGATSAMLRGNLTSKGGYGAGEVDVWFRWTMDASDIWSTTTVSQRVTTGVYWFTLSGLKANTTYEFEAVAYGVYRLDQATSHGTTGKFTTAANTTPVITEGTSTSVTMDEDASPTPFSLTLHATDADGDSLTWSVLTQALHGTSVATGTGSSKVITYIPTANYNGPDSFVIQVSDGYGGIADIVVNVTVRPRNDPPVSIVAPQISGTPHPGYSLSTTNGTWDDSVDSPTTVFTYGYRWQSSADGGLTWINVFGATNPTYTMQASAVGKVLRCVVTCLDKLSGVQPDQSAQSYSNLVRVVNQAPIIAEGATTSVIMDEDASPTPFSLALHATDADSDTLTWNIVTQPLRGTAAATGTGASKVITYIPTANYNGSDSFVVRVSDTYGGTDDITVNVTITAVNDAPSFTKGGDQTAFEDTGLHTVVGWASAMSAGPADEAGQALDFIVTNDNTTLFSTQPAVAANGTLTYTLALNRNGSATVTICIHDDGGTANAGVDASIPQTFTITVNPHNDPPVDTYTVTYTAGANGTISGTSPQTVNQGASSTSVTAVPQVGYHFVTWSDGSTANPRTDTNVTADITVTASFAVDTFAITVSAGANGSIDPSGSMSVNSGSNLTFTITPSTGYHVLDVLVDGSSVSAGTSYTFTNLTENHTIAATFAINPITISTYTVTYTAGANGTISGTSPQTVNQGASSTAVTGTPNGGYHFVSWSDGSLTAARTDTNVTVNVNVTASFAVDTFAITASAGANGAIDSSGSVSVSYGGTQFFTINPSTGYHVLDVFVDTVSVGAVSSYTFTNVTANHTIAASFAVDTFAITVIPGPHGTATPGTGLFPCHAVQAYVVKPDAGYMVDTLAVDGVVVNEATNRLGYTVTLISIEAPHTIVATFASIPDLTAPVDDVPSFTKGPDQTVLEDCGLQTVAGWATSISAGPADEAGQAIDFIVTNDNTTLFSTQPAVAANGTLTFTPAADASGTAIVTLALTDDATAGSSALTTASQSFTITVTKVADIVDDTAMTLDDTAVTTHVPANDNFEDMNRHVSVFTPPSHGAGVINAGTTIGYAPVAPFPVSPRHTMVLTIDIKTMTVDSARVVLDAPAAIVEDRTLVPLRAVVEHLGGSIVWDAKTRQVTLKARGTTIVLTIGKSTAFVNDKPLAIDPKNSKVVPLISSGRTLLPLRFVAENLGLQVEWNAETRTITVNWED
jgi:hypothetical protein